MTRLLRSAAFCYHFFYITIQRLPYFFFFFFNDTATTEIYTLSLHDALPISPNFSARFGCDAGQSKIADLGHVFIGEKDRKSTRLNSSHDQISYAVFCLKKKKKNDKD